MRNGGAASSFRALLLVILLGLLVWGGLATFRAGPVPALSIRSGLPAIGKRTSVTVVAEASGRGLAGLSVELVQGDRVEPLAEKTYQPRKSWQFWGQRTTREEIRIDVGRETIAGLKPGEAVIRARARRAGTWLRKPDPVVNELKLTVRLTPPSLYLVSTQHYAAQGGSEVVVYRVGDSSVRDGVRAGDWWFPGYPLPGGGPQDRFAFFGVPYDLSDPAQVRLVAADDVGNQAERSFLDKFFPRPFAKDTIEITEAFMAKVVPDISSNTPELGDRGSPLENYLAINRELRQKNAQTLKELAAGSRQAFLWKQPFRVFEGGQVMSSFADRRTYVYQGRTVDHQDHLGFDLASTRHVPVPAANGGVVALAEYLGIYGNSVVIDHGYGLMSLYAHLSGLEVAKGQEVERGHIIGRSGDTGLAGGDHLHFTVLLQGLPVNPKEWWDPHWIRDRVGRKLGTALPFSS